MAVASAAADDGKPAPPIDCWDFETTVNALKAHPEADCNGNGVIDSCDTFGARFVDRPMLASRPFRRLAVAQLDDDDAPDVVAAGRGDDAATLYAFVNRGGELTQVGSLALGGDVETIVAANLLGSSVEQLAVITKHELIVVEAGISGLAIKARVAVTATNAWEPSLAAADLDGDGTLELLARATGSTSSIEIFAYDGGALTPRSAVTTSDADNDDFAVGDVDGDRRPDIVYRNDDGVTVLRNQGNATFQAKSLALRSKYRIASWKLHDLDGDGKLDLYGGNGEVVAVRLGDGTGGFPGEQVVGTTSSDKLIAADIDRDKRVDLIGRNFEFFRVRHSRLGAGIDYHVTSGPWVDAMVAADLNGDGGTDLIYVANAGGALHVVTTRRAFSYDEDHDQVPDECHKRSFYPQRAGNGGPTTVQVHGAHFTDATDLSLQRPDYQPLPAASTRASRDGSTVLAVFDLRDVATGAWLLTYTGAGGKPQDLGYFIIEPTTGDCLVPDFVVRDRVRTNTPVTIQMTYTNACNQELAGVAFDTRFPPGITPALDDVFVADDGSTHVPIVVPLIAPYSSGAVAYQATIAAEGSYELGVAAHAVLPLPDYIKPTPRPPRPRDHSPREFPPLPDYFKPMVPAPPPPPSHADVGICYGKAMLFIAKEGLKAAVGASVAEAAAGCARDLTSLMVSLGQPVVDGATGGATDGFSQVISVVKINTYLVKAGLSCALAAGAIHPATAVAVRAIKLGTLAADAWTLYEACGPVWKKAKANITGVASVDPNALVGPGGTCPQRFVTRSQPLRYRVEAENLPAASAFAARVTLRAHLETSALDLTRVRFGPIVIAGVTITPGADNAGGRLGGRVFDQASRAWFAYETRVDHVAQTIEWTLEALDGETLALVDDPDRGLLAPNTRPPLGEASVSFEIEQAEGGEDVATVSGEVVFDQNPAIATNRWTNRIVAAIPSECPVDSGPAVVETPVAPPRKRGGCGCDARASGADLAGLALGCLLVLLLTRRRVSRTSR